MKKIAILSFTILVASFTTFSQKTDSKTLNLDEIINGQEFRIESSWARAQAGNGVNAIANNNLQQVGSSGNRFNLVGNFNYLEMRGETVAAYLPYFGERQFGNGHYAGSQTIEFDGVPRELTIEKNEKKKRYEIRFEIDQDTETFQVHIELYESLKSKITVNSNQRFIIRYDGKVSEIPEKEEAEGK